MSAYFSSGNDEQGRMVFFSPAHPQALHAYMKGRGVSAYRENRLMALYNALGELSNIGPDAASFELLKAAVPLYKWRSVSAFKADLKMLRDMNLLLCTRTDKPPQLL